MPAQRRVTTRRGGGFRPAATLLQERIRTVGESRGFAVSRLLTHWAEIVGEETAQMARPVKVSYRRDAFGATLTLLTSGAAAPMVQMQLPAIRTKVNACYGYNAISRIVLTQTAPAGFSEAQAAFNAAPSRPDTPPDPGLIARAEQVTGEISDEGLRAALAALAEKILTRDQKRKEDSDG